MPFTHFTANINIKTSVKKWLYHSETFAKGALYVNQGAKDVLLNEKASLLMIGVTKVEGYFRSGDIVRILDEGGNSLGLGKSQFDSEKAEQSIGQKLNKAIIHYDYLVINEDIRNSSDMS